MGKEIFLIISRKLLTNKSMNMNKKGFANIVLIILVVVLAGVLGYVTLVKKPAPVEQPQTSSSQNTQATMPTTNQQTTTNNKEVVEHYLSVQGNPTYKTVELSDVINFSSISVNNYIITKGTVVFVKGGADVSNPPSLVLSDNSGHYIIIPVAHAFYGEWGPLFSKLKVGDTVQAWGIAEQLDVVSSFYRGVNFNSKTVGGLNLTGIKKL